MASPLQYKIYDRGNTLIAATKGLQTAVFLVNLHGTDTTIKVGGRIVWREGVDTIQGTMYDTEASFIRARIHAHNEDHMRKNNAYRVAVEGEQS